MAPVLNLALWFVYISGGRNQFPSVRGIAPIGIVSAIPDLTAITMMLLKIPQRFSLPICGVVFAHLDALRWRRLMNHFVLEMVICRPMVFDAAYLR